jgi:hypothetical protein
MKLAIFIFTILVSINSTFAQSQEYNALTKSAYSLYEQRDYKKSATTYSEAFKASGGNALPSDHYNAACSWALAGHGNSAFFHLRKSNFADYVHVSSDSDLASLHSDKRWNDLLALIKVNKEKAEVNFNKPLVAELEKIFDEDQLVRKEIPVISAKYGWEFKEMKAHWKVMGKVDSINVIKVRAIIDKQGWLGKDVIGGRGNATLFLVIQHSDLQTREKYLPIMRETVKNGNAKADHLALMEDRAALEHGKRQIYGSQIHKDPDTQKSYLAPLDDPDNVDKRRASVGLEPLTEYLKNYNIIWDVEKYKAELPLIEIKEKTKKN